VQKTKKSQLLVLSAPQRLAIGDAWADLDRALRRPDGQKKSNSRTCFLLRLGGFEQSAEVPARPFSDTQACSLQVVPSGRPVNWVLRRGSDLDADAITEAWARYGGIRFGRHGIGTMRRSGKMRYWSSDDRYRHPRCCCSFL